MIEKFTSMSAQRAQNVVLAFTAATLAFAVTAIGVGGYVLIRDMEKNGVPLRPHLPTISQSQDEAHHN